MRVESVARCHAWAYSFQGKKVTLKPSLVLIRKSKICESLDRKPLKKIGLYCVQLFSRNRNNRLAQNLASNDSAYSPGKLFLKAVEGFADRTAAVWLTAADSILWTAYYGIHTVVLFASMNFGNEKGNEKHSFFSMLILIRKTSVFWTIQKTKFKKRQLPFSTQKKTAAAATRCIVLWQRLFAGKIKTVGYRSIRNHQNRILSDLFKWSIQLI